MFPCFHKCDAESSENHSFKYESSGNGWKVILLVVIYVL